MYIYVLMYLYMLFRIGHSRASLSVVAPKGGDCKRPPFVRAHVLVLVMVVGWYVYAVFHAHCISV